MICFFYTEMQKCHTDVWLYKKQYEQRWVPNNDWLKSIKSSLISINQVKSIFNIIYLLMCERTNNMPIPNLLLDARIQSTKIP